MSLNNWCIKNIQEHDKVTEVEKVSEDTFRVKVVDGIGDGFLILTRSEEFSTVSSLDSIVIGSFDFFLNIKKDAHISGELLTLASLYNFAIGDLSDLYRALQEEQISNYINPNIAYIIRALKQHNRVESFYRLDNCRFRIKRKGLADVTIIALNNYDLTADIVRSAIEKYEKFDAIFTSNPNCQRAKSCEIVAADAELKILSFGELMGALHREW